MMANFGVANSFLVRIAGAELTLTQHLLRARHYAEQLTYVHSLSPDNICKNVVLLVTHGNRDQNTYLLQVTQPKRGSAVGSKPPVPIAALVLKAHLCCLIRSEIMKFLIESNVILDFSYFSQFCKEFVSAFEELRSSGESKSKLLTH